MKRLLLCVCFLFFYSTAQATIIDLPEVNGRGYFLDESTGKSWVDINIFRGVSGWTIESVSFEIAGTDFHLATLEEVTQLYNSMQAYTGRELYGITGVTDEDCEGNGCMFWFEGFFDDIEYPIGKVASITHMDWKEVWYNNEGEEPPEDKWTMIIKEKSLVDPSFLYSYWVTKNPAPEPATMLLFGLGLLGIAGINRRKKKQYLNQN